MPKRFVPSEQYYTQLARVRQGAGALITTVDGRVVMYDVSYRDYLELPGGAVEAGESPPAACRRECQEELGIDISVGRILVLDHQTERETEAIRSCSSTTAALSTTLPFGPSQPARRVEEWSWLIPPI